MFFTRLEGVSCAIILPLFSIMATSTQAKRSLAWWSHMHIVILFSLKRNSMLLTKDVLLENSNNRLKADVVDLNITTKDTKISMFEKDEKVNIRSKF